MSAGTRVRGDPREPLSIPMRTPVAQIATKTHCPWDGRRRPWLDSIAAARNSIEPNGQVDPPRS